MISQQETPQGLSALAGKSTRFKSIVQSEVKEVYDLRLEILNGVIKMRLKETGKRANIDEMVEAAASNYAGDWIMDIANCISALDGEEKEKIEEIVNQMKSLGKISWIRELVLERAYDVYNWHRRSSDLEKALIDDLESYEKSAA